MIKTRNMHRALHSLLSRLAVVMFAGLLWGASPVWAQTCGDGSGDIQLQSQAEVNAFQADYGTCDVVEQRLVISGSDINDLSPLASVTEVKKGLSISNNPSLQSLAGLDSLHTVFELNIAANAKLSSLSGLDKLHTVQQAIYISSNESLQSLDGLSALQSIAWGLWITSNPVLTDLSGLSGARVAFYGDVRISSNDALLSLEGLPLFAEVTRLEIGGNDQLKNLQGLSVESAAVLETVSIQQNPALVSLTGLEWMQSVTTLRVVNNPVLPNLHGLSGLKVAEQIVVTNNDAMLNLQGLEALENVADIAGAGLDAGNSFVGDFWIHDNPQMNSVKGLSGLQATDADIWLNNLPQLASLSDLARLSQVQGFTVSGAPKLTSLHGLEMLRAADRVGVSGNSLLQDCSALEALLDVIDHDLPGPGPGVHGSIPDVADSIFLENNGSGCNAIEDIAPRPDISHLLTGSWYSPASAGEGFMIHAVKQHLTGPIKVQNGLAVGYFYGYDEAGQRFWLIGVHQGAMHWDQPIRFAATAVAGGSFEGFDPAAVAERTWGEFNFTPHHCGAGEIQLSGEFAAGAGIREKTLEVERLGKVSGDFCSQQTYGGVSDSLTGSWYDPLSSGQGFAFHKIDDDTGIVYFYGFQNDGTPLWLIGVWNQQIEPGQSVAIEMNQVSGGTFSEVNPGMITEEPWGTLSLHMNDCDSGVAGLDGVDGVQQLELTQLAASLDLECP